MSSSPVKKRHHVDNTASQKHDLCLYKEQNAKATQVVKYDDTPASRVITSKMAETALDDVINFFEATPSHLTQLWTVMADIKQLSKYSVRQSTMLDFFRI